MDPEKGQDPQVENCFANETTVDWFPDLHDEDLSPQLLSTLGYLPPGTSLLNYWAPSLQRALYRRNH